MKRILACLLGLILALACCACGKSSGDFKYAISNDGTIKITDYTGDGGDIVIPAEIDARAVTSVGNWKFSGYAELYSISIPQSVINIFNESIFECPNLYGYEILDDGTVKITGYIGKVSHILLPAEIDGRAVTRIGYYAFNSCTVPVNVRIPSSVTSIDECAFWECAGLTSVVIPKSVASIGDYAFSKCPNLKSVAIEGGCADIGDYAFSECANLESVTIESGVTSIGYGAFADCPSLASVKIPESVTRIADYAFDENADITLEAVENSYAHEYAVENDMQFILVDAPVKNSDPADFTYLTLDDGTIEIEYYIGAGGDVVIPAKIDARAVTSIGQLAFYGKSHVTSVIIPDGVKSIGGSAFLKCYNITSVTIPNSVKSIGEDAFRECSGLTSVAIPHGVKGVKYDAFSKCSALESVTIPDSVTYIGSDAFAGCASLKRVAIPESVTSIDESAFDDCPGITLEVAGNSYAHIFAAENGIPYVVVGGGDTIIIEKTPAPTVSIPFPCAYCSGSGQRDCISCFGRGRDSCYPCGGMGSSQCRACGGSGQVYGTNGYKTCGRCGGGGRANCVSCYGAGYTTCTLCYGVGKTLCAYCQGSGSQQ